MATKKEIIIYDLTKKLNISSTIISGALKDDASINKKETH
jgi:hypothetical protein